MGSARVGGYTIAEYCEAPANSCIDKSYMESLHGFDPMGSSHNRSSSIYSSIGAIKSGEAIANNAPSKSLGV